MVRFFFILLLNGLWGTVLCLGQGHAGDTACSKALGGTSAALASTCYSIRNPASPAAWTGHRVSLFSTQFFGMPELRQMEARGSFQLPFSALSLGFSTFGFEAFRQSNTHVGFARGFTLGSTRTLYLGLRGSWEHLAIPGYGSSRSIGMAFGMLLEVMPGLSYGMYATNLHQPSWTEGEPLPRHFSVGVTYRPNPSLSLALDGYREGQDRPAIRGGLSVSPTQTLSFRMGAATEPALLTLGLGLWLGPLTVEMAGEHHAYLGWSPAVEVQYTW